ncbi:DUF4834 family protein [Lacinutrix neustonica]|uniref:DUF4834 family protein n=1 Tax=Lacinutrix neustonica TaxID=2980107 RepID=A0A9E8MXY1_9FLAO|nr:DUF4834 family protein [Lacinutrix neustonica]WAC02577.1 DUF4834 family protein [Lacinutrix neustonica]
MQLLRTILIILVVYYGFKILSRLFGPLFFKYLKKKAQQRFGGQFGGFQNQKPPQKPQNEGEITIDKMPDNKSSNKTVGEYVDYEEID